jgi:hypothetical protein
MHFRLVGSLIISSFLSAQPKMVLTGKQKPRRLHPAALNYSGGAAA